MPSICRHGVGGRAVGTRCRRGARRRRLEVGDQREQPLPAAVAAVSAAASAGGGPPSSPSDPAHLLEGRERPSIGGLRHAPRELLAERAKRQRQAREPRRRRRQILERRRERAEQIFERRHDVVDPNARTVHRAAPGSAR
jgi:hypothetical protein